MSLPTLAVALLAALWSPTAHAQSLSVTGDCPELTVEVTGATPGSPVQWMVGSRPGTAAITRGACSGTTTGLDRARDSASGMADAAGTWTTAITLAPTQCGRPTQAIDAGTCTLTPVRRTPSMCDVDADCDDGNDCTIDSCRGGACIANGTGVFDPCDDGSVCTVGDTCAGDRAGTCAGAGLACDDGVSCTTDVCDPVSGCMNSPDDAACDDGTFCNGEGYCDGATGCQFDVSPDCDDLVACTLDFCNEGAEGCDHLPDDAMCDNGDPSDVEMCDADLGCVTVAAEVCNGLDDDGDGLTDEDIACDYTLFSIDPSDPSIEYGPCADDDISVWLDADRVFEDSTGVSDCASHPPHPIVAMPGQFVSAEAFDAVCCNAQVLDLWLRREADGAELLLLPGTGPLGSGVMAPLSFWADGTLIPSVW